MLLDVIFFVPTLFTYILITLLVVILCFIIVYVSHKLYISIYDNLPLDKGSTTSRSTIKSSVMVQQGRSDIFVNQASLRSIWITNRSLIYNSKAVLRIIISLETCYLAFIEIDIAPLSSRRSLNMKTTRENASDKRPPSPSLTFIKYYDHLTKIPKCNMLCRSMRSMESNINDNMRSMIDAVITSAMSRHGRGSFQRIPRNSDN